jgi:hypothetical protein
MITLSIPNYNRSELVIESFTHVINDDRINEIIISDDFSDIKIYNDLNNKIQNINNPKIKLYRNESNLGAFLNKQKSVILSNNDWIILLDSDNIINTDYIDTIIDKNDTKTIYCPSHAICSSSRLNYKSCVSVLSKKDYKNIINNGRSIWDSIFNTGNYFFYKKTYLECIDKEEIIKNPFAADVYYMIYLLFKNIENSKFEVVNGLSYHHRLHSSSYFLNNSYNSEKFVNGIIEDIKKWS